MAWPTIVRVAKVLPHALRQTVVGQEHGVAPQPIPILTKFFTNRVATLHRESKPARAGIGGQSAQHAVQRLRRTPAPLREAPALRRRNAGNACLPVGRL
jgi:hypothetical protein